MPRGETALVFGASGQDGHYLSALLRARGVRVVGVARSQGSWVVGDVQQFAFVEQIVRSNRPTYVFHLAAESTTRHSALFENHETIATGALNVLESVRRHAPSAKVFIAGSGVQFENRGQKIRETDPFFAGSPYAIARIQSVYAARYYRTLGVRAYVGYLFHHESPLRRERHVSKQVVAALTRIKRGEADVLEIADADVKREWLHAEDAVRAIHLLVAQDDVYEATIGSGEAHSISEWISACSAALGLDPAHLRLAPRQDIDLSFRILLSDPSTIRSLGWSPRVGFEELARIMTTQASRGLR